MIYTIGSWEITGPVEMNANDLTEEENALLMRLFKLGLGHTANDTGLITLRYNKNRTMTQEEERRVEE